MTKPPRLGCPFPKCFPEQYEGIDNPCTRRLGFDGFRLLNEHIWKYHSYRFLCPHCYKRFTTASYEKVGEVIRDHVRTTHGSGSRGSSSSSSSSSSRKTASSGSSKRRRNDRESSDEADDGMYAMMFENMTKEQDAAFEEWQKKERKFKKVDDATKFQSLYQALFGTSMPLPETPYFDYLVPIHLVNQRLAALGLGSLADLESKSCSLPNSAPTRSFSQADATSYAASAMTMPGEEHLRATEGYQNPYNVLYGDCTLGDLTGGGGGGVGAADGGGDYGGLPGTHAPHHHHLASHPSYSHHRRSHRSVGAAVHHPTSWTVSASGPGSGSSGYSEAMPQTPVAMPADEPSLDFGVMTGADGFMHSDLRDRDYSGGYDGYGSGMGKRYGSGKNATFNQATILGMDQMHHQVWDGHPVIMEDFSEM